MTKIERPEETVRKRFSRWKDVDAIYMGEGMGVPKRTFILVFIRKADYLREGKILRQIRREWGINFDSIRQIRSHPVQIRLLHTRGKVIRPTNQALTCIYQRAAT